LFELGHVTDRRPPFRYAAHTRVGFSETDAQGVVYYGRYLPYFDLARTEYHRHLGRVSLAAHDFVMRAATVEYHAPARFDDLLEVFVRVERIGRTSVTFDHAAYRIDEEDDGAEDVLMVTAKQTLVLIDLQERAPAPVPDSYRSLIADFEGVPA
jgi:acyl-CoA thioester hydrolase